MRKFDISTDSTCDLYAGEIKEHELYFLPLNFTMNDQGNVTEYKDTFQSPEEYVAYYNKLRSGITSKTSMNNPFIHEEHFRAMAQAGVKDAIHFTISYGLCRTVDVAREAVEAVKKEYPDFNCLCVECSTTTIGQGMLVKIAINMRNSGKTLQETFDYVEKVKYNIQHFIVVDDLSYLVRGGRLSATAATVGKMLNVKPVLIFNKEGKLQKYKQSSGLKHTVNLIAQEYARYTINKDYSKVIIGHTDNTEMAWHLKKLLYDTYKVDAEIRMIGPVIGSHLGPNVVAYIFLSEQERPI